MTGGIYHKAAGHETMWQFYDFSKMIYSRQLRQLSSFPEQAVIKSGHQMYNGPLNPTEKRKLYLKVIQLKGKYKR